MDSKSNTSSRKAEEASRRSSAHHDNFKSSTVPSVAKKNYSNVHKEQKNSERHRSDAQFYASKGSSSKQGKDK